MLRIETANNVGSRPAPLAPVNTPGFFNNAPGSSPGTVVGGDFLNRVQEELVAPILAANLALDGANNAQLLAALRHMFAANGQCALKVSSTTQLLLVPRGGNILRINSTAYAVPNAGVTIPNTNVEVGGIAGQNLVANTDYLLFMKDDGTNTGVMVPSFWITGSGHMPDTTAGNLGVEVRNNGGAPDSTRSLVGLVGTDASAHFIAMYTRSWFNRGAQAGFVQGSGATGASIPNEISGALRVYFMCFADDLVVAAVGGFSSVSSGGSSVAQLSIDGIYPGNGPAEVASPTGTDFAGIPYQSVWAGPFSEGRHYATLLGNVGGSGTATFSCQTQVAVR
jgi:hypothetical protein